MPKKPILINGARSVMAGRKERSDSLDLFCTPPWATRALVDVVLAHHIGWDSGWSVWEPACGRGHMSEVLTEYFQEVMATDIKAYEKQGPRFDFLTQSLAGPFDWIITNPPFNRALDFTLRALDIADFGVAMFVRSQWAVEGVERYERLWRDRPPTITAFFSERVNLCKGRWDPDGSTATAYCWLVWVKGRDPLPPFFIPPGQRKALTRPDDRARFAAWSLPQQEAAE
jgi:hypothetical protein